ncbi:probable Sulfide:quinone oxidoreductase, mitochondrial precursor [Cephalotrichum gorgonifer]|uniref:Probable Sulfide:quinone oxidoreductase, mitochondrial n=1 Tax=Cephalotrichum gorgonifer TaxID=2041049 RepID=A0AAE8SSA7_9PEZI|nr:probable Sulfide:quinone oxidoreductase, mitochondrial precursor [Cephalotrichum gorgonifer]
MSLARLTRCASGIPPVRSRHPTPPRTVFSSENPTAVRGLASETTARPVTGASHGHKIIVVGGGSAGLNVSHQLLRSGRFLPGDIAIVDPATWHDYQPGWTLVGGGLKTASELRKPLADLIDSKIKFYNDGVGEFKPQDKLLKLSGSGDTLAYDQLVVAPGIKIDYASIKGLPEALADPGSLVTSTYGYDTCQKVNGAIQKLHKGQAIFTLPSGPVKCAGGPQKIMWLALDYWKRQSRYDPTADSPIHITWASALPAMFGVPKYSAELEKLRRERGVEALFQHDLISIDDGNKATFARPGGSDTVTRRFDFLHAVPKMGPHAFVKNSPLADNAGFVDVDSATTRHKIYHDVWSVGDASNLPTSKTAAAITSQAPVLVRNLLLALGNKEPSAVYDGYTSCPLVTDHDRVLLAEFKYGGVPKETFGWVPGVDQAKPHRAFFWLKKHFFPWVYYKHMVKGTWGGPAGWIM